MEKLILFLNSFMSYLLLVLVIVAGSAIAFVAGRLLKKRNVAKAAKKAEQEANAEVE